MSVSTLEADIVYFEARLALLSRAPNSYYQLAQFKAYSALEELLSERLGQLRRNAAWAGDIEVSELTGPESGC